jgi:hypothetical protein
MVRSQTLPFNDFARATSGQLTWVYLNQLCDYEDRLRRIHVHCLPKFHRDLCEVCGEAVSDVKKLPEEIRGKVYVPSRDGMIDDIHLEKGGGRIESPPIEVEI